MSKEKYDYICDQYKQFDNILSIIPCSFETDNYNMHLLSAFNSDSKVTKPNDENSAVFLSVKNEILARKRICTKL